MPAKKRILAVCVKLFLEKGYKQTTLAEINEKAGVSYSTFQNIFRAKDGVLTELVEFMFENQFAMARSAASAKLPPVYELRDESNELIDKANELMKEALCLPDVSEFDVDYYKKSAPVDTFSVKLSNMAGRLDASYHVPIVDAITAHLQKYAEEVTTVGDKRISKEVILPMRFKRVYVDEGHGRVLFGGKQLYELDPSGKKARKTFQ